MRFGERYFFNESRDPVQREIEQDRLISHAKMAREQQRVNPDLVIIADVNAMPAHISKPLLERIKYFHSPAGLKLIPAICAKQSGLVLSGWSVYVTAVCLRLSGSWRAGRAGGAAGTA